MKRKSTHLWCGEVSLWRYLIKNGLIFLISNSHGVGLPQVISVLKKGGKQVYILN